MQLLPSNKRTLETLLDYYQNLKLVLIIISNTDIVENEDSHIRQFEI